MDKNTVMREGLLLNSTPPTEATAPLGVDEVWVKTLFTRVMEYVAQEKEGLQTAEEVSAAIQEAIKGITCLSNETVTETIDFGSHQVTTSGISKSETVEKALSSVELGNIKRFDLTLEVTLAKGSYSKRSIIGELYLPSSGRYIKYNVSETNSNLFESVSIVEGGAFIDSVTAENSSSVSNLKNDLTVTNKISVYLARFD